MRRTLRTIAFSSALCLGFASGAALLAQDNQANAPQDQNGTAPMHHGHWHGPMSPDQELAHMTRALQLNSDQQSQLMPILQSRQQQLMQVHQDTSMSREDRRAKMKSIDDDANSKVEAVLNDQQKAKFEKMVQRRQERMEHMHEMRQNGDSGSTDGGQPQ